MTTFQDWCLGLQAIVANEGKRMYEETISYLLAKPGITVNPGDPADIAAELQHQRALNRRWNEEYPDVDKASAIYWAGLRYTCPELCYEGVPITLNFSFSGYGSYNHINMGNTNVHISFPTVQVPIISSRFGERTWTTEAKHCGAVAHKDVDDIYLRIQEAYRQYCILCRERDDMRLKQEASSIPVKEE